MSHSGDEPSSTRVASAATVSRAGSGRVDALTGIRAVAAMFVVATHAAYCTGKYTHGYVGLMQSRLELGVPIFFVLSGFLLFLPWVRAAAGGVGAPSLKRYAWHRFRRIMPAYWILVLIAYGWYHVRDWYPNPGHTWLGFFRNITLTQIYTSNYGYRYIHQGMTQIWSLAVEAAFYVALPFLAWLLIRKLCGGQWRPVRLLGGLVLLALVTPMWMTLVYTVGNFPDGAKLWLPAYLSWFVGGMILSVLAVMGVRCEPWLLTVLLLLVAAICYLIVSTPIAGQPTTSPWALPEALTKSTFYLAIATLLVAPAALADQSWYSRLLASRPMVWLGEISYELFLIHMILMEIVMVDILHYHVYTGSVVMVFLVTMLVSVPASWLIHRVVKVLLARGSKWRQTIR
jgi:peptidoglycan/LPS O-acetylase OafA/YrhL